MTMIIF